jgi:glycine betaine/choline ABC-type transport system substrate-binding protein
MKKQLFLLVAIIVVLLSFAGCQQKDQVVQIAHKDYTEQRITGQMMAVYLESKGYKTEVSELSGTLLCYTALRQGDVDVYAEFTGSAYGAIFDQTEILGVQETYDYVKARCEEEHGITWLQPLGWNNTFILAMRAEEAAKNGITDVSSLVPYAKDYVIGCDDEFIIRTDGLPGLKIAYEGLTFKREIPMDQGLTYAALRSGDLDVISAYSTDGRIEKYDLVTLADNKNFFPPYFVTPIIRLNYAQKNPEIVAALNDLGGRWTDEDMQHYNLLVDEGADAREVAKQMLRDVGLID